MVGLYDLPLRSDEPISGLLRNFRWCTEQASLRQRFLVSVRLSSRLEMSFEERDEGPHSTCSVKAEVKRTR